MIEVNTFISLLLCLLIRYGYTGMVGYTEDFHNKQKFGYKLKIFYFKQYKTNIKYLNLYLNFEGTIAILV